MKRNLIVLTSLIGFNLNAQIAKIPQWFLDDIKRTQGTWVADNSAFVSEQEPYVAYINEWFLGLDSTSLSGQLHGQTASGEKVLFWEFKQYWDNETQKAIVQQFGRNNVIGKGSMSPSEDKKMEAIQTFSLIDGRHWIEKHETYFRGDTLITISFGQQMDKTWKKKRTYSWIKQENEGLGPFSMSLAVNDLKKSKSFYEHLGFKVTDGKIEQNWLILENNTIKIGLFKGIFPKNTITFNPNNARHFYQLLKSKGVTILYEQGMDKKQGACSFSFLDPDGNPILIDQHQ